MDTLVSWIVSNKEWLFQGLGVSVIAGLALLARHLVGRTTDTPSAQQSQTGGSRSTNIQAGRDISVTLDRDQSKK